MKFRRKQRTEPVAPVEEVATVRAILARDEEGRLPSFGGPCRCPECSGFGMVEHIDLEQAAYTCPSCDHAWALTRRALHAVRRDPTLTAASASATTATSTATSTEGIDLGTIERDDAHARSRANHPSSWPAPFEPTAANVVRVHFGRAPRLT